MIFISFLFPGHQCFVKLSFTFSTIFINQSNRPCCVLQPFFKLNQCFQFKVWDLMTTWKMFAIWIISSSYLVILDSGWQKCSLLCRPHSRKHMIATPVTHHTFVTSWHIFPCHQRDEKSVMFWLHCTALCPSCSSQHQHRVSTSPVSAANQQFQTQTFHDRS